MKYNLIDSQVKIKQANTSWLLYILLPLTFLGYYFFRKTFKFDGVLSDALILVILFVTIYGGYYFLGIVLPRYRFKKNLVGYLEINDKNWTTPNTSLSHMEIDSLMINHEFIERSTHRFDRNGYAWYFSVKLNELRIAFFVETTDQIEHLRKWIAEYYKRGIQIQESFGEDELNSYVLFVCEDGDDIKKVKDQYF